MGLELTLSLIAALCVITLAVAIAASVIAVRKAPPESNENLALRVSKLTIEVEDLYEAVEKWGRRQSVRDSRARKAAGEIEEPVAPLAQRTGILRQSMTPGARVLGANPIHTAGV